MKKITLNLLILIETKYKCFTYVYLLCDADALIVTLEVKHTHAETKQQQRERIDRRRQVLPIQLFASPATLAATRIIYKTSARCLLFLLAPPTSVTLQFQDRFNQS